MNYADPSDMVTRFGASEIADLDEDRVLPALGDASAEIDTSLAPAYETPLPSAPVLTGIACDLARERLFDDETPKAVKDAARRARSLLAALASGSADLTGPDGVTIARKSEGGVFHVKSVQPRGLMADALAERRS